MKRKIILVIINLTLIFSFAFSQHNSDFTLEIVDIEQNQQALVVANSLGEPIERVMIGDKGRFFDEVVHSYIVNKKNLSFILKTGENGYITYMWLKESNGNWRVIAEKVFILSLAGASPRIFDEYDNGGKFPVPFAYYLTKVNQLLMLFKNKNDENIEEVLDFPDEQ